MNGTNDARSLCRRARLLALLGVLAPALGCATAPRRSFAAAAYPGVLRPAEALEGNVLWRQRVTAFWGEGERRGFDAVIQKSGATLTVMGLSPAGSMGFAILWRGQRMEVQSRMPEELPFPPRFVLLDVQRVFYPWLPRPHAPPEGVHESLVDGERIRETWRSGRLVERTFERLDGVPAGTIVVRYHWDRLDWTVPARAVLDNGWFAYRLEVETHEVTSLDTPRDAAERSQP